MLENLIFKIESGKTFFIRGPNNDLFARYIVYGPVYIWKINQMIEYHVQNEDLIWHLQAKMEEQHHDE